MADCGRADLDDLRTSHHRQPGAEPVHHRLVALLPARGYRESGPRGGWVAAPPPAAGPLEGNGRLPPGGTICGYEVSPGATSASGAVAARGIGDCGLPGPRRGPAQFLLRTPRPEDIDRDKAAFQSDGLTNRRMRARMSGGVGGEGASPIPTRSRHLLARTWRLPEGGLGWLPSASRARPGAGLRLTLPRSCFLSRWRGNWR